MSDALVPSGAPAPVLGSPIPPVLAARRAEARWRPGLSQQPLHSEIFASGGEASGAGLALALARDALAAAGESEDARQVLWVQDRGAIRQGGRPCVAGLPPDLRHRLIHVAAATPEDALFALEEGLKCRDLACVIGEIAGNPRALSFTASRRLTLTAERHGVALWLVRLDAEPDLSSARMRWRTRAAPSPPARWNPAAPGTANWHAELFRARAHAPGEWMLSDANEHLHIVRPSASVSAAPDIGDLVRPTVGRSLAARARA
ncbi:recA-like protein [Erythrobacter sanguineus]|uniref:Protein ImuA n=1 Tax=Erythrobacter sanguineus TaxID=198312 RepID=A0A1M7RTJ9_9SPHN|nr:recA-like protein [Erythrobacter sanguineus]SHN49456.1 protein ImuA [Erythrobacter sanguineus]